MEQFKNPNGTYDGARMLSVLSGLSRAEIMWTFQRMKQLYADGKTKKEVKAIITEEAKSRPWEG